MTEADWNHVLDMYNTLERLQLASIDLEHVVPIRVLLGWLTRDMESEDDSG